MKVLCIHGVGKHPPCGDWEKDWTKAVEDAVEAAGGSEKPAVEFVTYDDIFSHDRLTWAQTWAALQLLSGSAWNDFWRPRRGVFDDNFIAWTAGMVAQWAGNADLRAALRDRLAERIAEEKPDVVVGHSLGSLVAYDLFTRDPATIDGRVFISFGSQINSTFVRGTFAEGDEADGGFIVRPLTSSAVWLHLHNPNDPAFAASFGNDMRSAANFAEYTVAFANDWQLSGHRDVYSYLTVSDAPSAWSVVVNKLAGGRPAERAIAAVAERGRKPAATGIKGVKVPGNPRRALLVGVNSYKDAKIPTLSGCLNDVFLVSAALQDAGFQPEDIRVVLDDRATGEGVRTRLEWLFDGVRPKDLRVLYLSGHGTLLPVFNAAGKPDRLLDAFLPHDFDGSTESALTDRDLAAFYERMPFDGELLLALDCCRTPTDRPNSSAPRRGVDLPDDIRHRMLKWNPDEQMWEMRKLADLLPDSAKAWRDAYSGKDNCVERLGRNVARRRIADKVYDELREKTDWKGPFLPVIFEACGENESAEEYLHGVASYGAFTYAFCHGLRTCGGSFTFEELMAATRDKLARLGYSQKPEILGPREVLKRRIKIRPKSAPAGK